MMSTLLSRLLVLPVRRQILHNGGIGESAGVAERAHIILGDLAQDSPHDLSGTRLGQSGGELKLIGLSKRPDLFAHELFQLGLQLF